MIQTGFESRVKIQQIIDNQLPEFILDESPKASEFLKQYYISQEYQGGPVDISENLDQYLKLDNLIPEVVVGFTTLSNNVTSSDNAIFVNTTKGFPEKYGLFKIDDEIITYTGITTNSFTGCIRGFSGITDYHDDLNPEELVFSQSSADSHVSGSSVTNLSSLFLKEFYKKLKYSFTPGLENLDFVPDLKVGNFIKEARSLYESKGTAESFRILFNVLYGETPSIIDLENFLIKPSDSEYVRREVVIVEAISGNPTLLSGQTIFKSTDSKTSASVSEVETVTRSGKTYYKLLLFVGYDDTYPTITGTFNITGSSRVLENVSITKNGNSVISVDSTIGFKSSGSIFYNKIEITYESKTLNQFLGCRLKDENSLLIEKTKVIRSDEIYYGYANGDLSQKVEFRITGVLSNLVLDDDSFNFIDNDEVYPLNLGEIIENPSSNATRKEIFANSWVYNTSTRYQIESFVQDSKIFLKSLVDKSNLKKGDYIELLSRNTENIINGYENIFITSVDYENNLVSTDHNFYGLTNTDYDVRRKLKKASSSIVPLEYGNETIISDILNVYDEKSEYLYVASNSLPSYTINTNIFKYNISGIDTSSYSPDTNSCSILKFNNEISLITGDKIYYDFSDSPILGLEKGPYFVEVLGDNKSVKLYASASSIKTDSFLYFSDLSGNIPGPTGSHSLTLYSQKSNTISPQKLFKKFKTNTHVGDNQDNYTTPGFVGMLKNGVEIFNYKTNDKIYYGYLDSVNVLNGGDGYDVLNPPVITPSFGNALLQPVVVGSVKEVYVDPQNFNIDKIVSIKLTGGNGKGSSFLPIVEPSRREIEFDARPILTGGGLDYNEETISFYLPHNLTNGQRVVYDSNNYEEIGIGSYKQSNNDQLKTLKNGSAYYVKVINSITVQLYPNFSDYVSGINTVGFTTVGNFGTQKFKTDVKNILTGIKVVNGGEGYTNRILKVSPSGISTYTHNINFKNHGFLNGELITYQYEDSGIVGLSTSKYYYVLTTDSNSFKLCDAGNDGSIVSNYERKNYVKFKSTGNGYQIFSYPKISLEIDYTTDNSNTVQSISATPVVKGQIKQVYVYDGGSDYGSTIVNVHQRPSITIKNGSGAQLVPIILNGKIVSVNIKYGGDDYYSTPNLVVYGSGTGALLRPVITNNKITNVIVVNSGAGYSKNDTTIVVNSAGKDAVLQSNVRSLTLNSSYKYGNYGIINGQSNKIRANEVLVQSNDNLQYCIIGYSEYTKENIGDDGFFITNGPITESNRSPIIGWSYDGNPIYGPYANSDPSDFNSKIKKIESGYTEANIVNRPSTSIFPIGSFVEDYVYTGSGDLDEYNGRFSVTKEFPNGVYAYYATITEDDNGQTIGKFPYFIGNKYRSTPLKENLTLDQFFDFNNSSLIRNTLPYKINDKYADYDFVVESNEIINQKTIIESVSRGSVTDLKIINSGKNYSIGDELIFDNSETEGSGVFANISEIIGGEIVDIKTSVSSYENSLLEWKNGEKIKISIFPYHNLYDGDSISILGLSTELSSLNGVYGISVDSRISGVANTIGDYSSTGIVTDIYLTNVPNNISVGSSIKIDDEIFSILNTYPNLGIVKVSRSSTGVAHTQNSPVYFLPDSFTINKKTKYFDSKKDNKIYFNPNNSIGIGSTPGYGIYANYNVGITTYNVFIPSQSIFIPEHPFVNGEEVTLKRRSADNSILTTQGFILNDITEKLYVINKSKDYIGLVTNIGLTTTSNGVYFLSSGSNSNFYSIESNYKKITSEVARINCTVSISTYHNLKYGDQVSINVKPNLSVGIGSSSSITVKFDTDIQNLIINPLVFEPTGINTSLSVITLPSHNLKTGDKVLYNSVGVAATGLEKGSYFVYKIDKNNINLCNTFIDSLSDPPDIVKITGIGTTSQSLSLINPQISCIKNNNLVFNLSDTSLYGYKLKIYYDQNFTKEFVSDESTNTFSIIGVGTVGVSSTASLTLNFSEKSPEKLYYALEKSGYTSTSDTEVVNYSEIVLIDSLYNGTYNINGVGSTDFTISLRSIPERLSYTQDDCDYLEYKTTSSTAFGGVSKIKLFSGGSGYKKLPIFNGTKSSTGTGLFVSPLSSLIGKIKQERIVNEGFEYSSDKTLRPTASIPKSLAISSANTIQNISIINGGKDYSLPPNLVCVDTDTGKLIDSGLLKANLFGSSISSVSIESPPKGLPSRPVTIRAINNSNGVTINKVQYSSSGIVTCTLTTPINGFTIPPFSDGEKIFVEGIERINSSGEGFNSADLGYQFFTVKKFFGGDIAKVEFDISEYTKNPGIAKTVQDSYASIIKFSSYPEFEVTQVFSPFIIGEKLSTNNGSGFIERDLNVLDYNVNFVRVIGSYNLSPNEKIRGIESFSEATVSKQDFTEGKYNINYSNKQNLGWKNNSSKLNEDSQVIPDNDYYQNLSYSIKSTKTWEEIVTPVNSLLHTSGLKNFSNSQIENSSSSELKAVESTVSFINNFINESKVDTINNFDFAIDVDVSSNKSKFLSFKKVRFSDYILCKTNRVLEIDDISRQFSSVDPNNNIQEYILQLNPANQNNRFLIQIKNIEDNQIQFNEIILMNNGSNAYTIEKGIIIGKNNDYYTSPEDSLASIGGYIDNSSNYYLKIGPRDRFNSVFDIKILNSEFVNKSEILSTKSIGFVDLTNSNKNVSSGLTTSIISFDASRYTSFYSSIHLINPDSSLMNYVEVYVIHDGTNSYIAESWVDNSSGVNSNFIGSFGTSLSGGILSLNYTNTSINQINIKSKTVGFGSTSIGIGTYRFISGSQLPGSERTVIFNSNYTNVVSSPATILSLDKNLFSSSKSLVKISVGNTSSLHQVMTICGDDDSYSTEYPSLVIGDILGIGTFGTEISGNDYLLKFYPDSQITENIEILSFNESFYRDLDFNNIPPILEYGFINESVVPKKYYGLNIISQKSDFDLTYNNFPIFVKTFNPSNSSILELSTGKFTIQNHFFNTGEELIYTPKSTINGETALALGIGETSNYLGITTNILPSKVWAIKDNNDTFRISTRPEYAANGIGVTFTSIGVGNAHEIEMVKKNEKSVITINNVAQYPLSYTSITHNLSNNGGQIGAGTTIFALSGISSIFISDILKIDNEYMRIDNVGFGTTSSGPISYEGNVPLVKVVRGFFGSEPKTHTDSTVGRIYKGSYSIVGNKIFFIEPPRGNPLDFIQLNESNLSRGRSTFSGRVFLRKNYSSNIIYDDISSNFNGIDQTFTLKNQGINTSGIGNSGGNGIVFINNIFQTPTTSNNESNNYFIEEDGILGISSIVFTGITSSNGSTYISEFDVNQNQIPRGGIIISLGSTPGLGYAPLVGASVTAVVNNISGSIISVGLGTTDIVGSGYRNPVSVAVTESGHVGTAATIQAIVGVGGTLSFNIIGGGSGYVNPKINISSPNYENLPVVGISRLGIGETTETGVGLLLNVEVGASSTSVGIGSTLYEVTSFKITRPGYSFKKGDRFTAVGLVTDKGLSAPIQKFELTVLDTFTDSFAAWQFGELDYIDSIKNYQNGTRTRFPLFYNGKLLSFEIDNGDPDSQSINFSSLLVIFINGVLQKSGESYEFNGGTSFTFSTPPKKDDKIDVFFYRGTRDEDSQQVSVNESVKVGDAVQVLSNNNFINETISQDPRIVYGISSADKLETNLYSGKGIDTEYYKPVNWIKQKTDLIINGEITSKSRNSLEPQIYPTSNIIKNVTKSSTEIFVDNMSLFDYELENPSDPIKFDCLICKNAQDTISASITAVVSTSGTISSLIVEDGGSGYVGIGSSIPISISAPKRLGVGIGTRATAYGTVSIAGSISSPIVITNPGFGYTTSIPPQVITPLENKNYELISNISKVEGFETSIIGIQTAKGIGVPLAIKFTLDMTVINNPSDLKIGYPIYISNTSVGNGVTSINSNNTDVVSISTSFVNNIYYVHAYNSSLGIVTCNVSSNTSILGILTTGTANYPVGKISWGRLSNLTRSNSPISIGVSGYVSSVGITSLGYGAGLSTYPTIQRKGYGLRNTGSLVMSLKQI